MWTTSRISRRLIGSTKKARAFRSRANAAASIGVRGVKAADGIAGWEKLLGHADLLLRVVLGDGCSKCNAVSGGQAAGAVIAY